MENKKLIMECKVKDKFNILTNIRYKKVNIIGFTYRTSKNIFAKKYDTKKEITLYFVVNKNIYTITEKQEFLNDKMVRIYHNGNFASSLNITKDKNISNFKDVETQFYIVNDNDFVLDIIDKNILENYNIKSPIVKPTIIGNEYLIYINDFIDDFGGIYINTNSDKLTKVTRDIFVEKINNYKIINSHDVER